MPCLVVRNLDESIINALKERAVKHHRSTEVEHRAILVEELMKPQRKSFAKALASMPVAAMDTDFQRVNDDTRKSNVSD